MKWRIAVLASLVLAYAIAWFLFRSMGSGLITPSGSIDTTAAILGVLVLVLRLIALFVVPALAIYWLTVSIWAIRNSRGARRRDPEEKRASREATRTDP